MRAILTIHTVAVATGGCSGEIDSPMHKSRVAQMGKGSNPGPAEERLVDEYLKNYPVRDPETFRENLLSKRTRMFSNDPEQQKAIDAIYDVMAEREKADGPQVGHSLPPGVRFVFNPSAAELDLINQFVARYDFESGEDYRASLMNPLTTLSTPQDPQAQKILDQIYKLRHKSAVERHKRSLGPRK